MREIGILIMAYGSPLSDKEEHIREYLTHILSHYRKVIPSDEQVRDLQERYRATGGPQLLNQMNALVERLRTLLGESGQSWPVVLGMRHSPPWIEDALHHLLEAGVTTIVAVPMAPFRSSFSTGGYVEAVNTVIHEIRQELKIIWSMPWAQFEPWLDMWSEIIREKIKTEGLNLASPDTALIFTNHSLPVTVVDEGEPYVEEFDSSAQIICKKLACPAYHIAYTSAGGGKIPWLKPDLGELLENLALKGVKHAIVVPIGFFSAHLEVLWDIDNEGRKKAEELGIVLHRVRMPVDYPSFPAILKRLVDVTLESHRAF